MHTTLSSRRRGVRIILFPTLLLAACMAGSHDTSVSYAPVTLPAVHTRYLSYPVPSAGVAAEFNPPVLRWPVQKGKAVKYEVRLSQDSTFVDGSTMHTSLSWAMFNPHQQLANGAWYWQYRTSGGAWSEIQRFLIGTEAITLVSPPTAVFLDAVAPAHPRVVSTNAGVTALRKRSPDADWRAIIAEAEAAMKGGIPTEQDGLPKRKLDDEERNRKLVQDASKRLGDFVNNTIVPLCQAYVLTGDARYRERALAIAFEVAAWDPRGVTSSKMSDFSDARCMLGMALAFDTFHDALRPDQRDVLIRAVNARAGRFYDEWVNNQEARLLSGHVWQHILHYFFQTSLAMYGDDPEAKDWLAYAYELFLARTPILGGTDGGWTEGVSYFRMNMETVLDIPLFIRDYTGFDFIRAHPWYVNNIDWLIYNIPPGSSSDGFGDNSEEVFSPGADYIAFAKELAKLTGSTRAAWYARACAQYEQPDLSGRYTLRWIRLTRTNNLPMPESEAPPQLKTGSVFREIGLVAMHSNPDNTRDDLMVAMRSSPFGCYGHFLSDQNAFNVLYGGKRTFFRTGYKVTMSDPHRTGWYQHTKSNNSVLINGEGQPYSTEAFGWIPYFLEGNDIGYAMGDASNAYASDETNEDYGVKKFNRHLILLKPDILVIYDELESEADATWSWLIHSMEKISVNRADNSFESVFGDVKGVGKLWSTLPVAWHLADTFDVPAVNWRRSTNAEGKLKTYDDPQFHLKALNETRASAMRFLAVLQIAPGAARKHIAEDRAEDALNIVAGDWRITANLDTQSAPYLAVRSMSGNTSLVYEGGKDPVLAEVVNGEKRRRVARPVMPWALQQGLLVRGHR